MNKKLILGAIIGFSLVFGGLSFLPASATSADDEVVSTDSDYQTTIDEGTSGEPEVICADENEPGYEDPEDTTEPALWPMYVSFAALGIAFVLIIIINLTHRRK